MTRAKVRALVASGLLVAGCGSEGGREDEGNGPGSGISIGLDTGGSATVGSDTGGSGLDGLDAADDLHDLPGADDGTTPSRS